MDLGTGLAVFGAKDLFVKILGPTADYIGKGLKGFAELRLQNLSKITEKAAKYLGDEIENPGSVPPRIVKEVIENGTLNNDELSAEYYGGILASSRSNVTRDDRSVPILDVIKSLSTYQLRTHYIFYHIIRKEFEGSNLLISKDANRFEVYIPLNIYHSAMNIEQSENFNNIISHSLFGLSTKKLIADQMAYGDVGHLLQFEKKADIITQPGIIMHPTPLGVELFLWANGHPNAHINQITDRSIQFNELADIKILSGYKKL